MPHGGLLGRGLGFSVRVPPLWALRGVVFKPSGVVLGASGAALEPDLGSAGVRLGGLVGRLEA
eukprot:7634968-Pyramimonas_sp.AAC.1